MNQSNDNETLIAQEYGLTQDEFNDLQLDLQQAVSLRKGTTDATEEDLLKQSAFQHLSFLVGCAFGRWDAIYTNSYNMTDIYEQLPNQSPVFKSDGLKGYVELNGIADLDTDKSLPRSIDTIAKDNTEQIDKAFAVCGMKDWNNFLSRTTAFFDYHLNQYSQNRRPSPIYWPLQTPSGSYTLWVYYHRLNEQTLYTCVNDFVEPKLRQVEQDLNSLRSKSTRSSQEEKELEKLSYLASELRDFRDELLRLAKLWKPNLNDGVQITAAPLWKLFQHKAWQKKLKDTWESLEKGDYDWAHLACSIWPERVLRKCHQDRSLAIAHDVEDHFWQEVEVPVKRGKKLTGETKLEWQSKALNEPALLALIKQIKEERGL